MSEKGDERIYELDWKNSDQVQDSESQDAGAGEAMSINEQLRTVHREMMSTIDELRQSRDFDETVELARKLAELDDQLKALYRENPTANPFHP